jgi:hypothetical protein
VTQPAAGIRRCPWGLTILIVAAFTVSTCYSVALPHLSGPFTALPEAPTGDDAWRRAWRERVAARLDTA